MESDDSDTIILLEWQKIKSMRFTEHKNFEIFALNKQKLSSKLEKAVRQISFQKETIDSLKTQIKIMQGGITDNVELLKDFAELQDENKKICDELNEKKSENLKLMNDMNEQAEKHLILLQEKQLDFDNKYRLQHELAVDELNLQLTAMKENLELLWNTDKSEYEQAILKKEEEIVSIQFAAKNRERELDEQLTRAMAEVQELKKSNVLLQLSQSKMTDLKQGYESKIKLLEQIIFQRIDPSLHSSKGDDLTMEHSPSTLGLQSALKRFKHVSFDKTVSVPTLDAKIPKIITGKGDSLDFSKKQDCVTSKRENCAPDNFAFRHRSAVNKLTLGGGFCEGLRKNEMSMTPNQNFSIFKKLPN